MPSTLALIAHDARKDDLVASAQRRRADLGRFALLELCDLHGVPLATNEVTSELVLDGLLARDADQEPT